MGRRWRIGLGAVVASVLLAPLVARMLVRDEVPWSDAPRRERLREVLAPTPEEVAAARVRAFLPSVSGKRVVDEAAAPAVDLTEEPRPVEAVEETRPPEAFLALVSEERFVAALAAQDAFFPPPDAYGADEIDAAARWSLEDVARRPDEAAARLSLAWAVLFADGGWADQAARHRAVEALVRPVDAPASAAWVTWLRSFAEDDGIQVDHWDGRRFGEPDAWNGSSRRRRLVDAAILAASVLADASPIDAAVVAGSVVAGSAVAESLLDAASAAPPRDLLPSAGELRADCLRRLADGYRVVGDRDAAITLELDVVDRHAVTSSYGPAALAAAMGLRDARARSRALSVLDRMIASDLDDADAYRAGCIMDADAAMNYRHHAVLARAQVLGDAGEYGAAYRSASLAEDRYPRVEFVCGLAYQSWQEDRQRGLLMYAYLSWDPRLVRHLWGATPSALTGGPELWLMAAFAGLILFVSWAHVRLSRKEANAAVALSPPDVSA